MDKMPDIKKIQTPPKHKPSRKVFNPVIREAFIKAGLGQEYPSKK